MTRAAPVMVALCYLAFALANAWAVLGFGALSGMSRWIFLDVDLPGTMLLALLVCSLAIVAAVISDRAASRIASVPLDPVPVSVLVAIAFAAAGIGVASVHHGYAFSMDEWMTKLQGALFLDGRLTGEVPEALRPYARAFLHGFARYDEATGAFASDYRPGMAALYALFEMVALGDYASSVLNAGAIVFTFLAARRLWPERRDAQIVAALLVATSQQALAAAMTTYAMSAHLFMATLWFWLFLRDATASHICAALVGVCAASLHQIHVHAFYAAPFLLTLLRPFRIKLIAIYGVIYLIGHGLIFVWTDLTLGAATEAGGQAKSLWERAVLFFALPDPVETATSLVNLSRLFTWQNAALAPLLAAMVIKRYWSGWTPVIAASVLLSFAPHPFLMPDQGHGWGYRYLHVVIGNLALLGAAGWVALTSADHIRLRAFAMLLLLTTALVGPVERALRIEGFVRPYAEATARVMASQAEIAIIEDDQIYYGGDIVRFDPVDFTKPTALRKSRLSADGIAFICRTYTVEWFDAADLIGPEPSPVPGCPE